ncbi:hypothetical protein E4U55_003123 [Claviceps digitariae]|nr:hypothetical protein E4U55_003123 [Claviceps digitariae]
MVPSSPALQEKLSVTTAIIGLLAVGGKTIDTLWDLNIPADHKSNTIYAQALQEIKQCRSTVHVLYKTLLLLELGQLPYPERGAWIKANHLIATLTDTVLAMSELQANCETLTMEKFGLSTTTPPPSPPQQQLPQSRSSSAKDKGIGLECASPHQKSIEGLCSRIRWQNLSMTMMMTILKCPGESDAQNSRVGLERRMKRLLSANTNLSARIRQLDDFFGHGRLGHESLPHYSPLARHPHFWLLPRLTPYPGTAAAVELLADSSNGRRPTTAELNEANGTNACPEYLTPLSGYTLADIPILSMIPLPVATSELTDGTLFYTFDYATRVGRDLGELMQNNSGQGTSRSLGVILGRMNAGIENGASSTSTSGSSSDSGPVVVSTEKQSDSNDGPTKATRWKVRNLKLGRGVFDELKKSRGKGEALGPGDLLSQS